MGDVERSDVEALDARDALAHCRAWFALPPGVVYLDGNSLGALPGRDARACRRGRRAQWGDDLIGSWNRARLDRLAAPARRPDRAADRRRGRARSIVADSTSVNLFKLLAAALAAAAAAAG